MKTWMILLVLPVAAAMAQPSDGPAGEGALRPLTLDAITAEQVAGPYLSGDYWRIIPATAGDGPTHPQAMVAAPADDPDNPVRVLIDSAEADGPWPTLVRIRYDAEAGFDGAAEVELTAGPRGRSFTAHHQPVLIECAGFRQPARVDVSFFSREDHQRFALRVVSARQGLCRFGDRVWPIRLIDVNSNLRYNDPSRVRVEGDPGLLQGVTAADRVQIVRGEGGFDSERAMGLAFDDVVWIGSEGYTLAVDETGRRIEAQPIDFEPAMLVGGDSLGESGRWRIRLYDERTGGFVELPGHQARPRKVVRPGRYRLIDYDNFHTAGGYFLSGDPAGVAIADLPAVTVEPHGRAVIEAPRGLIIAPEVDVFGPRGDVSLAARLDGYFPVLLAPVGGRGVDRLANPRLIVTDADGRVVHRAEMEYG